LPERGAATLAANLCEVNMRDYLAWRLAFGVTTPSTNTVVQPEYDDMRLPGVTNHLARMVIPDMPIRTNEDFDESIRLIDAALGTRSTG
jgi:maleate isomerase